MTAHAWYRPPIPRPPTVCEVCGAWQGDEAADDPCPGETPEPTDAQLEARYAGPGMAEQHRAAWRQHEEAHR